MAGAGDKVRIVGDQLIVGDGGAIVVEDGGTLILATGATSPKSGIERLIQTGAKVGGTAGWVIGAADNLPYMATMPAGVTAGKLIIPITGLRRLDTLTAFKVIAQIESAGNTVTLDAELRLVQNSASDPTDNPVGAMDQIVTTEDIVTTVTGVKTGLQEVAHAGDLYYLLLTATTAAATDIILLGVSVTVTEQ